jgi:pimeloyl-ACP methyl ester carboxylesterase
MTEKVAPTAGFRNAAWTSETLPDDCRTIVKPLRTIDNAATNGFLFARGGEKTVVCIMHPREFLATHYLIPHILAAGCAAWTQASRTVGNDLRLEHESVILDVAAAMVWLREAGFEKIILLGNSGGAGLYCFYNQQSLLAADKRLARTPGGRPTALAKADMPPADGIILVSPHPGQGKLLQNCIDPAVVDERRPLESDPSLDFMSRANGFAEPPNSSSYSAYFTARFREGQRARVERLDRIARELIAERMAARKRGADSGDRNDRVRGSFQQIMEVWRTDADLRCWDLSIEPSDRKYGSLWGNDPYASNYGSVGFARLCTPESWLSTWSGLSSRAALELTAPSIEQPALIVSYTGDAAVFPPDIERTLGWIASSDKEVAEFKGNHHGLAVASGEKPVRDDVGKLMGEWLRQRFPTIRL